MAKIQSKPLRQGLYQLVTMQPFWGTLALHMEFVRDDNIPTLKTDGKRIYYNKQFTDELSVGLCAFTIAHEVSHPFLGHLDRPFNSCPHHNGTVWARTKQGKCYHWHPQIYNIAGDHVINLMLEEAGFQLWPKCLHDPKFKGKTTEQVYAAICPPNPPPPPPSGGGGKGDPQGEGEQEGDGSSQHAEPSDDAEEQEGQGGQGDGMPSPDPITGYDIDASGPAEDFSQQEFTEIVAKAATIAKAQGKLPGSIAGMIKEATEPQYPVYMLLQNFVDSACKDDDISFKRPHRDFLNRGIVMPSAYSDKVSHVVLVYDTSGSVPDADLMRFHRVGGDIIRRLKPQLLTVVQVDAQITDWMEVKTDRDWPRSIKCKGRGGTSFKPVFEELKKRNVKPSCLVYLTDMYGDFPDPPPQFPVLWISTEKDMKAPSGMTIYFNDQQDRAA